MTKTYTYHSFHFQRLLLVLFSLTKKSIQIFLIHKIDTAYLSCIRDCFQLQSRQAATINDFFWDGDSVPHIWRANTGQGTGLHHRIRVSQANLYCIDKQTSQWIEQFTITGCVFSNLIEWYQSSTKILSL